MSDSLRKLRTLRVYAVAVFAITRPKLATRARKPRKLNGSVVSAVCLLGMCLAGCSRTLDRSSEAVPSETRPMTRLNAVAPERLPVAHLPNALRVHEKVISGGLPEGENGFRELAELGVQTIISVDGARPD